MSSILLFETNLIILSTHHQTTSGAQNEDAAKEIADLKKQLEQAKKTQRDFGMVFLVMFSRIHPY